MESFGVKELQTFKHTYKLMPTRTDKCTEITSFKILFSRYCSPIKAIKKIGCL